ncbi:MAG: conjugal transfer protein TrbL [Burkholderiales bacterium]|jgi:P-type conjugative transfer protein TrbL|nr:conjugal transfer protein TrbL [Burkholderiales bacterium]
MIKIKYLIICLVICSTYADVPTCVIKGGGILDDILLQFGNAATSWQNTIEPIAKKFFFILFGMEFMWQLTVKKVFAGDIEKLWVFFFTRTVLCFFFARYLVNIEMYRGIIEFLSGLGSSLGGFSLNMKTGSGLNTLGPSAVISNFSCMADMIHTATDQTGTFDYITLKITLAIIQVLLFIVLIFIAYYLMQIILQAYLIIYGGFIFAGFAGSSWTRNYWERYISATISVGIKFFVVCLIMGVLNAQMKNWATDINQAVNADLTVLAGVICRVFVTAVIISLALWQMPDWLASTLSGQITAGDNSPNLATEGGIANEHGTNKGGNTSSFGNNSGHEGQSTISGRLTDLVTGGAGNTSLGAKGKINPFGNTK